MTPVKEKADAVEAGNGLTGEASVEADRAQHETLGVVSEREGRRAGILLIVIGCVLIALAAGEASAATIFALVP